MTTAPHRPDTDVTRPGSATAGAVLVAVAALAVLAQPLWFLGTFSSFDSVQLVAVVVQMVVPAAAYAVCVPGLLRGRQWARVAVTALAAVHVLGALPNLVLSLGSGPDPMLLAYTVGEAALVAAVALLWTPESRAWFGPVT